MYPQIIATGLFLKHAHRSRALHALHKKHHLKKLHVGKGVHRRLSDDEMNVSHVGKARRLVPLKIAL